MEWFLRDKPYRVRCKLECNGAEYACYLTQHTPVPSRVSLMVGDCIHNLRSVLDNLIWTLTECNGNAAPKTIPPFGDPWRTIAFPLRSKPFPKTDFQTGAHERLWGIAPGAKDLVEWLQPYKRSDETLAAALAYLEEFANMSKHRFLPLALGEPFLLAKSLRDFPPATNRFNPGPLGDGAEIARMAFATPQREVKVDFEFVFAVLFDEPTPVRGEVTSILSGMAKAVDTVVSWFEPLV